jgi:circadian clock protein KaiC
VGKEKDDVMDKGASVVTGIAGFDEILRGGFPRQNIIVVQGKAGTGKTLFGTEFIYRGITQFDEPGIIVLFETSAQKAIRDAAGMGWDLEDLQTRKKLQIVFTSPEVLEQEVRSPDSLLLETAAEIGAQRIFIDGIGLLAQSSSAGTPPSVANPYIYRSLLQQFIEALSRENLTVLLSHEISSYAAAQPSLEAVDFLADTVIGLSARTTGGSVQRFIEIVKSRGQDYDAGQHTLKINSGNGLQVFRRVQAPLFRNLAQPTSMAKRSLIGVPALDDLIGGGIYEGSTSMVIGVSGVGKTVLGTQLLRAGVMQYGQPGMLVSLDEHPAQILRNSATLGLDLQQQVDAGQIHILFKSPQELEIDVHFAEIVSLVEKHNIQRLVIDGMSSYSTALSDQGLYRNFFHALVAFSKSRLMTSFFNYENPEFLGISTFMPDFPVSSIVDNIILLSLVELNNSLRRCVTVVKSRGSAHQFDSREYRIREGGIHLVPESDNPLPPIPVANYSSILSRAPTRFDNSRLARLGATPVFASEGAE